MTTTTKPLFTIIQRRRIVTKTLAAIRKHGPTHFDMSDWIQSPETANFNQQSADLDQIIEDVCGIDINDCGTTACMAGHMALALSETDRRKVESQSRTAEHVFLREVLGHEPHSAWSWTSPFASQSHQWPEVMKAAYNADSGDQQGVDDEWVAAIAYLENWLELNPA
jgi:hypothetical protein